MKAAGVIFVNSPIELTEPEREAAIKAARGYGYGRSHGVNVVERILEAVNEVRGGPPVGIIRRSSDGHIAERRESVDGVRYWACLGGFPLIGPPCTDYVAPDDWETIYTPQPKPRIVDELGESEKGSEWVDRVGDHWRWGGSGWIVKEGRRDWRTTALTPNARWKPYTEVI